MPGILMGGISPIVFHKLISSVPVRLALQSDLGVTLDATKTRVTAWTSQVTTSGSFTLATTSSAEQPAFNASGLNGFPTITFDGINDNLRVEDVWTWPLYNVTNQWTFAVFKQVSWTAGSRLWAGAGWATQKTATASPIVNMSLASSGPSNSGAPIGSWVRGEMLSTHSTSNYIKLGATSVSGTDTDGANTGNYVSLGCNFGPGSNRVLLTPCNIALVAFLICAGQPSAAEKLALSNAARRKYGTGVLI